MMTEEKSQDVAQPDPSQTIVGGGGVVQDDGSFDTSEPALRAPVPRKRLKKRGIKKAPQNTQIVDAAVPETSPLTRDGVPAAGRRIG